MKHYLQGENLIYLTFFIMAAMVLLLAVWAWYEFTKKDKPVLHDDAPARYEDFEECFYNPEKSVV